MSQNKKVLLGPVAFATSVGVLFKPGTVTGGTNLPPVSTNTYYRIYHITVINTAASAGTFNIYKETATPAGAAAKSIVGVLQSVAANSAYHWYGDVRVSADETDLCITGLASAVTMTVVMEAEMGIV